MNSLQDQGQILLDPNTLAADGTISLNNLAVSNDGKVLAYGLSKAGSDWVEIHFMDIITRKDLPDVLKWVKFSAISWQGSSVYYSRYAEPEGSELSSKNQFHQVYKHMIGTPQGSDILIMEDKKHGDYNFSAVVSDDEKFLYVYTSQSTSGERLMVKDLTMGNAPFITISDNFDNEYSIFDNIGSTFYLLTNNGAPNYKLVTFTLNKPDPVNWKTVIPERSDLLEGVRICNNKIVANYLVNVTSRVLCFDLSGKACGEIKLPGLCKVNSFYGNKKYNLATFGITQFTSPEQILLVDMKDLTTKIIFTPDCKFDSKNYITRQVFFESKDKTKVPMFITHRKDVVPDENTPCFVFGYGGFNISIAPEFRIDRTIFLEAGGIYCVPNIRGGGEYGEKWHREGTKCKKQNVFDDFIAACDYLVKEKYTSYKKIAIHGRSNGGLLVGAVMTQRPDICKVAIPAVGVLDMLRFHIFTIGRAWSVDYGNSENLEEFGCLLKYSPLHNVRPRSYPATLILTGDHDDRVVPAHSFKFAATLQQNNKGPEPVLIRIDVNAGHGAGKPTSKQIAEFADMWTFVFSELGM
jgi:prolyl oligopeptidase